MKNILTLTLCFMSLCAFAQMQVDKKIEMTGATPSDKKIEGIEEVVNSHDAANKEYVDTTVANAASGGNQTLSINCDTIFISGGNYIVIPGLGAQFFSVQADAGPDQLGVTGSTATMAGNLPANTTGLWTIVSGAGGSFVDDTDPGTDFNGVAGNSYVLRWTLTGSCGNSYDDVNITLNDPEIRIFVTASSGSGNMGTWANAGGLSGLNAADRICKYDANNPDGAGNGNWKAFLSTTTVDARDRIKNGAYYQVNGVTLIASNKTDLLDGALINPVSPLGGSLLVWTGSNYTGTYNVSPPFSPLSNPNCTDWSLGSGGNGAIGKATVTSGQWVTYTFNYGCTGTNISEGGNKIYLYCFED